MDTVAQAGFRLKRGAYERMKDFIMTCYDTAQVKWGQPAAKARDILAQAAENPERTLYHLEKLAGIQKGG